MSGHSKWSQIKRAKGAADKKRGNLFTKLSRNITIAAREGGTDPEMNFRLRMALDQARAANMPGDTIDRAIQRGSGSADDVQLHEVVYEAFSPGGIAMLIMGTTDNPNRAVSEIRHTVTKHGGRLGEQGSVRWMFEQVGIIRIPRESVRDRDALELALIDAGAEEIQDENEELIIMAGPEEITPIVAALKTHNITPTSAETNFVAANPMEADAPTHAKLQAVTDALLDLDDVQQVFSAA